MGRLAGRTAIITGASQGIGRAIVDLFAEEGARVYAADLNEPQPAFDASPVSFFRMDVSSEAGWSALIAEIEADGSVADILINNAGTGGSQLPLDQETVADWERVIAVNQTGVFLGMRAVLPGMRAKGDGAIVNISSVWGVTAVPHVAAYQATKAAVRHLSKHAAVAYARDNIRVNSVYPGLTATPAILMNQATAVSDAVLAATPMGRMGEPRDIAQGCLYLASDEARFVTGAELAIDGGYLAQ